MSNFVLMHWRSLTTEPFVLHWPHIVLNTYWREIPHFNNLIITVWPKPYFWISIISLLCGSQKMLSIHNLIPISGGFSWVKATLLMNGSWFQPNYQCSAVGVVKSNWYGLSRSESLQKGSSRTQKISVYQLNGKNFMISWEQETKQTCMLVKSVRCSF